jgi:hypothetical protein
MNKPLIITLLIISLSAQSLFAQKQLLIKGKIFDAETRMPISETHIVTKGSKSGSVSDKDGNYSIAINEKETLIYTHIQYKSFEKSFSQTTFNADILLEPEISTLPEAIVKPIVNISRGMMFDVLDYYLLGDSILYAGYCYKYKKDNNPWIILKSPTGDTIFAECVKKEGKFYKDCFDNIHYLTPKTAYQLIIENNKIQLEFPTDIEEFTSIMYNCETNINGKLIFSQFHNVNQLLLYYYADIKTFETEVFRIISDEAKIEMLAYETVSLINPDMHNPEVRFLVEMFYTPVFAPIIKVRDTIHIINYTQSKIETYDKNFKNLKNIPIYFQNARFCKEEIITDEATARVYAVFKDKGKTSIKEIFLKTGELGREIDIPNFFWIDNIKIHNNKLYFLYREKLSSKLRALYKMNLD